jgi:diaminopimelate epimerase
VEDETLACGTGITAAALAWHIKTGREAGVTEVAVQASGDHLRVRFAADGREGYNNIWLCGPATEVFEGNYKTF